MRKKLLWLSITQWDTPWESENTFEVESEGNWGAINIQEILETGKANLINSKEKSLIRN